MIERKILMDTLNNLTRRVVLEEGMPVEYALEARGEERIHGNLYLGRVVNILKGMRAAFVDIGIEKNAFLPMDDMPSIAGEIGDARAAAKPPRVGQEIIVQVVREPGGGKGPRVTMNPTFPGKYAVLLPTIEAAGVSRHIQSEERRAALYGLAESIRPAGAGIILRTAAEDASDAEIKADAVALSAAWDALANSARTKSAPALLFDDGSLLSRARRDLNAEITSGPFDDSLEAKLEKAFARKVWLDCGGFLVFDRTEAMTVIDVNSGKYTGKRSLGETLLRLNTEAAREIGRLIRLRDIGGVIVVDFVDMETDVDRQAVLDALRDAMARDRAKYHIHGFTGAGLLELTRRPVYQPVEEALMSPCPRCRGMGTLPSANARALLILREIRRRCAAGDESEMAFSAPKDAIRALDAGGLPERVVLRPEEDME